MHHYQRFTGQNGDSNSVAKWNALQATSLFQNKRVLDIGCNEGFFCLQASEHGALCVKGIDNNSRWIDLAKSHLTPSIDSKITYIVQNWNHLDLESDSSFDVILLLSSFHYATSPEYFNPDGSNKLLNQIARILVPGGILILECGIVNRDTEEWVPIKRRSDIVTHGTRKAFDRVLKSLFSQVVYIGRSVDQSGDSIPRHVFHCIK